MRETSRELKTTDSRIKTIQSAVTDSEFQAKRLKESIKKARQGAGVDEAVFARLEAAKDRAEKLHRLLVKCRSHLGDYFHRVLQESVSKAYDAKATDGSRAHINKNTLLPSILVKGQPTKNLGGGQSQLLVLAYVVALAKLRQEMHAQMENLGVRLGKIGDLSFFMDSPLGNMEEHYRRAAVELIPRSARQVVILLWKEDWEFARPTLEPIADRIWAIRFLTRAEDRGKVLESHRIYQFSSNAINPQSGALELIGETADADDQPRSELISIK
ncbi:MAG: hypothetical protein KDM64_11755 [Verrucomicrobiae bacterium]|nr:hypothetical protein [Verrucomicrobiae bacterium]